MKLLSVKERCKVRNIKAISFTDEYTNEFIKLNKEANASLLVWELLKEHYKANQYNFKGVKRDLEHIKVILNDIVTMLEINWLGGF